MCLFYMSRGEEHWLPRYSPVGSSLHIFGCENSMPERFRVIGIQACQKVSLTKLPHSAHTEFVAYVMLTPLF